MNLVSKRGSGPALYKYYTNVLFSGYDAIISKIIA